jgi:membrane associated rhomboid family serine protease
MEPWGVRVFLIVAECVALVPLGLAVWLWRLGLQRSLGSVRGALTTAGIILLTLASIAPPLWLPAMHEAGVAAASRADNILSYAIFAVVGGAVAGLLALVLFFFGTGRVRWVGVTACALVLALFGFSFTIIAAGAAGL